MKFFDKLFRNKGDNEFRSNNAQLLKLIRIYWKDHQNMNKWKDVYDELHTLRPVLFVPVANHTNKHPDSWTQQELSTLIFQADNMDGLLALGVFTDKQTLINRIKKPNEVTAIHSCDLLKLLLNSKIDRIVINNLQKDWFFLPRHYDHVKNYNAPVNSTVTLWIPYKKPTTVFINDLCFSFKKLGTVKEVYFCGHTVENVNSYVLAIKLLVDSRNARDAIINTFQRTRVKHDENFDLSVDLDFITPNETKETHYDKLNALIYRNHLN